MQILKMVSAADLSQWTMFCTEKEFWKNFSADLKRTIHSIDIVSPFIRYENLWRLKNQFRKLRQQSIAITVYTRSRGEHRNANSFNLALWELEKLGIRVKKVKKIHHKIAVIDDSIWWEGSMNLLSFYDSHDHMRRFVGTEAAEILQKIGLV